MNNAENSISEPLGLNIFWGSMPPTPLVKFAPLARSNLASSVMKVCLPVALCGNGFAGVGGKGWQPYWIWKIVRPSEKILATPLSSLVMLFKTGLS